ncbi:Glycerophosphodiester phosphodiesterase [Trichinella pseudospiralis]
MQPTIREFSAYLQPFNSTYCHPTHHCHAAHHILLFGFHFLQLTVIDAITSLFEKYPDLYDTVAVSSFHPQVAFKIVKADPKIITGHTWCRGYLYQQNCDDPTPRYNFSLFHYGAIIVENIYHWLLHDVIINFTGARLILAERRLVSQDYIDYANKRGLHVVVWTVNKLSEQEYFYKVLRCAFMSDHLTDFVNNNF